MYARHSLVWLTADGWRAAGAAAPEHAGVLARWQAADWPLVSRRRDDDAGDDELCLGLALPPDPASGAKLRIALRAPAAQVARSTPPLSLKAVLATAPEKWRRQLALLNDDSVGLSLRVYGSLALQTLTGQAYLQPSSDIDILFYPATAQQLRSGLALLSTFGATLPLDGEIVFPNGEAVAWKEWRAAVQHPAHVLAKGSGAVRLAPLESLLATLRSE
ncbi:malonate decarboxylase holo-[acyl-carrier-protein] synthase [Janthinobacterium fluminis]|uniref:Malonate decarboxylase holo-[acyl-carrier-protein] synthase n=1 Tax=Janthinobacterium fluminis TaxID=2987524 RepID=A0ABT5JUC5_9BURK|nr:malonate decarboxylase holo-[acyl-carrier-protein] synthase [Janthinobacterium fluminis]MDC8756335.1 malonate decarboxylase holo-[acyl-carrier-protein] synthase [Janthinobacterium fluminis]